MIIHIVNVHNPANSIQNINLAPINTLFCQYMQQSSSIVSFTGFGHFNQHKYNQLLDKIEAIGCQYIENITNATNILLVNKTCTEKYQIAELPNSKIKSVTEKWLNDSFKSKKVLDTKKYKITKIFYGVRVGIAGFEKQKTDKILKVLKDNGAVIDVIEINSQQLQSDNFPDIIISNAAYIKKMDFYVKKINAPVVEIEWLEESLKSKLCKFPENYALNRHIIRFTSTITKQIPRISKRLDKILQNSIQAPDIKFMTQQKQPYIFHFDVNTLPISLISCLKKIVCLFGGIYLDHINPIVTHLLVGDISEKQYLGLLKQMSPSQIFRVQWIIDTILYENKMPENDYKVRCFKQIRQNHEIQINTNSFSFQNSFINLNKQSSMNGSNFISLNKNMQTPKQIKITKIKAIKSQIFKQCTFFIESSQKKLSDFTNIISKIKQNGGIIYQGPHKNRRNYLIMTDCQHNQQIIQYYQKKFPKIQIIPVSIRWVDYCIKKTQLFPYDAKGFLIFKPFSFKTPLSDFMRMKFEILGVDEVYSRRIRQLLSALGSSKLAPNKSELTHCLCGPHYKQTARYREIRKQNKYVKFLKFDWVVDIVNSEGKIDTSGKFEVEIEQQSSCPEQLEREISIDNAKTPQKITVIKTNRQLSTQQRTQNQF